VKKLTVKERTDGSVGRNSTQVPRQRLAVTSQKKPHLSVNVGIATATCYPPEAKHARVCCAPKSSPVACVYNG